MTSQNKTPEVNVDFADGVLHLDLGNYEISITLGVILDDGGMVISQALSIFARWLVADWDDLSAQESMDLRSLFAGADIRVCDHASADADFRVEANDIFEFLIGLRAE